ncbi:helix-turn-helix domain-containing protein [Actinomadura scrupuli]|uniref:helix-turn-helix domain-containing protein n=1 Tax=Actinomadura scrupuli TaxID=559629 RepID=UPI003D95EE3D
MTAASAPTDPVDGSMLDLRQGGPTVLRMLLGAQLRRLRIASGLSREEAGAEIRSSDSKISRLELGRTGFKRRDVADLLALYGVDEADREALLSLALQANTPGWWHNYSDLLPSWFEVYIGLEEATSVIRTYEVQFVPGLFQTEDYARAVILLGHGAASATEIERRVDLRIKRQTLLTKPGAPRLWAVVDEAALLRPLGGRDAMRHQLQRLIEISELPNVTLQIVPLRAGGHSAAGGPFTILRFAEPELPDVVYMEQLTSAIYLEKRDETTPYMEVMDRLCVEAEPATRTTEILAAILKRA